MGASLKPCLTLVAVGFRGGAKARAARGDAERGTKRNEAKRSEKLFKKLA
jgi:hypothetical protein